MKVTLSEIKKNPQGTNSEGKEVGVQINGLEPKEGRNSHPVQNEETRIQKNEDYISSLWDNFKRSNIHLIGVPEREEKE